MARNIFQMDPKELIKPEHYEYYQRGIEHFFLKELVHLNVNLFILDHVIKFPFPLFTSSSIFFRMVFENFFFISILIITRIATDPDKDFHTLQQFKNRIRNTMIRKVYQQELDDRLREIKFDKRINNLLKKASKLRSERIAHIKKDIVFKVSEETLVYYRDLITIKDQLEKLFSVISFGLPHLMLPIQYSPRVEHPVESDNRSDIEKILDLIARDSPLLNMPEKKPGAWELWKKDMPASHLEILNQYRQKFGKKNV